MNTFKVAIRTRRNSLVDLGIRVNQSGEIVHIETQCGEEGWEHLGELIRLGYAQRVGSRGNEEIYRLRKDRCQSEAATRSVEPDLSLSVELEAPVAKKGQPTGKGLIA